MNKTIGLSKHKRVGLLSPFSWLVYCWLFFEHVDAPDWIPVVAYTLISLMGIIVIVAWFNYEERELAFHQDGKVTWK